MWQVALVSLVLASLLGCGRTVAFKDGQIADAKAYNTDYNHCVQESKPLYPMVLVQQPRWVQVPVYSTRIRDGKEERYVVHYASRMVVDTVDMNESEREAYVSRCVSAKGYTYRYLSNDELEAAGIAN